MTQYVFENRVTPRGKYVCVVKLGLDIVATSLQAHDSCEAAMTDARDLLERQEQIQQQLDVRHVIKVKVTSRSGRQNWKEINHA